MNRPEWGAMYFDNAVEQGAKMFWGARAVINRQRGIEIYRDRQNFVADDETDKEAFFEWLNDKAIPAIEKCIREYRTEHIIVGSPLGKNYSCIAEDRNSGGYLYIGAWACAEDEI